MTTVAVKPTTVNTPSMHNFAVQPVVSQLPGQPPTMLQADEASHTASLTTTGDLQKYFGKL